MTHKPFDPHEKEDRTRLIGAVAISFLILLAFGFFTDAPAPAQQEPARTVATDAAVPSLNVVAGDTPAATAGKESILMPRGLALNGSDRVMIRGDKVSGSIALKGARLDDLTLLEHKQSLESDKNVALLSPQGTRGAYYIDSGFLTSSDVAVPARDALWTVKSGSPRDVVPGGAPVVLQWDNGAGVIFEKSIALDESYLFKITHAVVNNTGRDVSFNTFQLAARHGKPADYQGFFVHHEGPVSFLNGDGEEPAYKTLEKDKAIENENVKGWLGFTDRYWMVTVLPDPSQAFNARMMATHTAQGFVYQADAVTPLVTVASGARTAVDSFVYAGVKDLRAIRAYEAKYGFANLQYSIDFGMLFFLTKPLYFMLHYFMGLLGSVGGAILLLTVFVRALVYPLANKSFTSMAKMKTVAPQMKEIQEKYKDDREKMQAEIMELYKREDVNPFSGCWPLFIQVPIFFALYKVILISVELRHAPFWGWVDDLSAPDPTTVFNLFGLIPWEPPQILMLGAWPLIFCFTMILQKRITPPMADPMQEKIQTWFPYVITVMLSHFAVGLVIYWSWSNVLGTLQQYYILKTVGGEDTSLIRGHAGRRKAKAAKKAAGKKAK